MQNESKGVAETEENKLILERIRMVEKQMEENEIEEKEVEEEMSFAELLEANLKPSGRRFSVGDAVSARVVKITRDTVFLDLGGKSEGFAEVQDFLDKGGQLTVREGERVEMRVASTRDGIYLTKGIKAQG